MIDLDAILFGNVTMQELGAYFKNESFDSEEWLVKTIRKHLLTEAQRKTMFDLNFTVEDALNGRTETQDAWDAIQVIYADWNQKLGHHAFGF